MTTAPEVVARIAGLALAYPAYGCNRLEALLALEGRRVSAITVQKILNDKGLGTRHERWLALERQNAETVIELSPEQAAFLEKRNPCYRERHVESSRPGELLSAERSGHQKFEGEVAHEIEGEDQDERREVDAAEIGQDIPDRPQQWLGHPIEEVLQLVDQAVAGVDHVERD